MAYSEERLTAIVRVHRQALDEILVGEVVFRKRLAFTDAHYHMTKQANTAFPGNRCGVKAFDHDNVLVHIAIER